MLAIIPARGGSKGIVNKNIRILSGKPLIEWSIEQALACPLITRVVVTTDSPSIAKIALDAGAEVPVLRPDYLSTDTASTESALLHVLGQMCPSGTPDSFVLLQPTSPLRLPRSLEAAILQFESQGADSLLSVCESHAFFWRNTDNPSALYDYKNRPRRQDISPADRWYRENGSIYISRTKEFLACGNRLSGKIAMYVMQEQESYEIDTETDFVLMQVLFSQLHMPGFQERLK
jgi:N-acylneuraminate cytidylyltransferase